MKQILYILLIGFVFLSCSKDDLVDDLTYEQPNHCMHPEKQINFVKQQISEMNEPYYTAFLQLMYYADSILNVSANVITNYNVPGRYVDPAGHATNSLSLQQDAFNAYCTSLAYCLTDEERYGQKACYFLNTWAYNNTAYSGDDGALVMSYSGSALMFAAELMMDKTIWKEEDEKQFKTWVRNVYQKASNSIRTKVNNWSDWGVFGSLLSASMLNDNSQITANIVLLKSNLSSQISPEGVMPYEIIRGDNGVNQAFWYTYFAMAPITGSLWIAYNLTGENLFTWQEDGKSVKKVLDNLLYYYIHPQEWKWSNNKNFVFQSKGQRWLDTLIEAMSGIYNDPEYIEYVEPLRPIIYPHHDFVWVFPTLMPLKIGEY